MSKPANYIREHFSNFLNKIGFYTILFIFFIILTVLYFGISHIFASSYRASNGANLATTEESIKEEENTPRFKATHVATPNPLKGVYMTSWVAGTPSIREKIIKLLDTTEANAVIIDIKDDTGRISFEVYNETLKDIGSAEVRIADLRELIQMLHEKNVYVIGRISSFQDPYMVKLKPEWAVKRASDGEIWRDRKGISWIDAGAKENWDYLVLIGKEAYEAGFDELNYDYIRFPSDGNMNDIHYPFSELNIVADEEWGKAKTIEAYFKYLHDNLKDTGAVLSADLFGMTTTNYDDLNIGQVLERALPYFDYIAPMVYPSHYPKTFIGLSNPAEYPYEIIDHSMSSALKRVDILKNSTTTPKWIRDKVHRGQIRPWLQDFDLGAVYTASMIRKQIQAVYDNGLTSWMMWDASNTYTPGGFLIDSQ